MNKALGCTARMFERDNQLLWKRLLAFATIYLVWGLLEQSSTATDHNPPDTSGVTLRRLNDGRKFQIVKVFYDPAVLEHRLSERGSRGWVRSAGNFFLYGCVQPNRGRRIEK